MKVMLGPHIKKYLLKQAIEVLEKTRGYHLKTWDDRELHRSHASSINTVHWLIQLMGCMGYSIWRMNSTIFIWSVITMWLIYFCRKLSNAELLPRDGQTMGRLSKQKSFLMFLSYLELRLENCDEPCPSNLKGAEVTCCTRWVGASWQQTQICSQVQDFEPPLGPARPLNPAGSESPRLDPLCCSSALPCSFSDLPCSASSLTS